MSDFNTLISKKQNGFTLVEVVVVLILIGILAATAASKFTGTDTFEAYTFRASLISALRLTQQRAMQQTNTGFCHQIVFNDHRYGIPDRTDCAITDLSTLDPDSTGLIVDPRYNITFKIVGVANPSAITFNNMGRPVANVSLANNCDGGCDITIQSSVETLKIRIESEGYIHAI